MFRRNNEGVEVFLVHPGGPFWVKKDVGSWTIPKGEYTNGEEPIAAAQREFIEETGFAVSGDLVGVGLIRQAGGKTVAAWAFEGDCNPDDLVSNQCKIEWPPRSGRFISIPEVDRGKWFSVEEARKSMVPSQTPFLDRLLLHLDSAL